MLAKVKKRKHSPEGWKLTLLALPFVIYTFLIRYVPLLGWGLAFTNYRPGKALAKIQFVGLKYFKLIGYYWPEIQTALLNTIVLSILSLAVMILPMIFAICLNEIGGLKLKKFIQTVVTLPHFVGWVIVYSMMFALLSSGGMVNTLLTEWGIIEEPLQVLGNLKFAWPFMILLDIWKGLGWDSIIYMAAITGIDTSIYEAASIDGAGRFAKARYITLPSLVPTFIVLLVIKLGNLLSVGLDKYLLFSNAVTMPRLEVLDMFVYRVGLMTQDYSFAIAVSVLKSVVSILMIVLANTMAKKIRGTAVI